MQFTQIWMYLKAHFYKFSTPEILSTESFPAPRARSAGKAFARTAFASEETCGLFRSRRPEKPETLYFMILRRKGASGKSRDEGRKPEG